MNRLTGEYWPLIGQNWSHHLVSYWSGQSDMYFVYIKIFQTTQGFPAQSSIQENTITEEREGQKSESEYFPFLLFMKKT